MSIKRVKLVGVCVRDQAAALAFFKEKLGFEVRVNEPMGPDSRWIEVAPPGAETGLALWTPPGLESRIGAFSQVVFRCVDVPSTYQELKERGVKFREEPKAQQGGVMAQFVDVDGNVFVLTS